MTNEGLTHLMVCDYEEWDQAENEHPADEEAQASSYNGYEVIPAYGDPRLAPMLANGKPFAPRLGVRSGSAQIILNTLANWLDTNVEPMDPSESWSFSPKTVTGGSGWSCHASATAIDYNAQQHPQGAKGTWTPAEIAKIDNYLRNHLGGVVRWGEHFTYPTKTDGMHLEIYAAREDVDAVAARLATDQPLPPTDWFDMASKQDLVDVLRSEGISGAGDLGRLEAVVNRVVISAIRSEGISGAGDTGRMRDAIVPAILEALGKQ